MHSDKGTGVSGMIASSLSNAPACRVHFLYLNVRSYANLHMRYYVAKRCKSAFIARLLGSIDYSLSECFLLAIANYYQTHGIEFSHV